MAVDVVFILLKIVGSKDAGNQKRVPQALSVRKLIIRIVLLLHLAISTLN